MSSESANELADEQSSSNQADGSNAGNQAQGAGNQPPQNTFWSIARGVLIRALMVYFIMSFLNRRDQPKNLQNSGTTSRPSSNLFENATLMSLYVYVSESSHEPNFKDENELAWVHKNIMFGDWEGGPNRDGILEYQTQIKISENVQNNGNLYIHVYLVREGYHPYPGEKYLKMFTVHKSRQLNRAKKRKIKNTHNLWTGKPTESSESQEVDMKEELVSHWHPNLTINVIYDQTPWMQGSVPAPLDEFIQFEPTTGKYYPIIYLNDYWNYLRDYYPINSTTKILPLRLTYQPLSMFKWQLYTAQLMKSKYTNFFGSDLMEESEADQDSMKETLLETSPYLLALTIIISISHSIFEFLAFKNDIQFWRNRRSLEGLSVRSVFFNVFQSTIVFLYVLDNDTNVLIKISIAIGLLIELWKIHKVTNLEIDYENKWFNLIPRIKLSDKGSYVESSTREYDLLAFKYLSWAVFPLFIGYAAYSLIYVEHKGWYSFVLSMTYGFLLTFGFIAMTPQLFINYKLKSVAHLPWRMLTYKFLNTFIDDIFAFVIKMPTMYRIGCFRDDVIFLIYLYQRWIYRVDFKRLNEFGVSGEDIVQAGSDETETAPIQSKEESETKKDQ